MDVDTEALELAFERLLEDHRNSRTFGAHPYLMEWVVAHRELWLGGIADELAKGTYRPKSAATIEVPKPDWHWRPGLFLALRDQLVYQYLGVECLGVIAPEIEWSAGVKRFSYHLEPKGRRWFRGGYSGWKNFDVRTLEKLDSGAYTHVLTADISAYYENIDIAKLIKELSAKDPPKGLVDPLSEQLNGWAGIRGRGIPQTYSTSHLLSEFYLNPLDRALASEEFDHLRYVDDIRIFCVDEKEARRALQRLARLLRDRALNLQSAKTKIQELEVARREVTAVPILLHDVSRTIGRELLAERAGPYMTPHDVLRFLRLNQPPDPKAPPLEVLERAWGEFVERQEFNKTVFHFLTNRLADVGSDAALGYCATLIGERPEETDHCLGHITRRLGAMLPEHEESLSLLPSKFEAHYSLVVLKVLRWFRQNKVENTNIMSFCRGVVRSSASSRPIVHEAVAYVSQFAEHTYDWELLLNRLSEEHSELDRATIGRALKDGPSQIVNSALGRLKRDGGLAVWALA